MLQQGKAARTFARVAAERRAFGEDVAQGAVRRRDGVTLMIVRAERVQEIPLDRRSREPELLALPVDGDEVGPALGEPGQGNGLAVQPCRGATRLDLSDEGQLVIGARSAEHGLDPRALRSFPDHPGGDAAAGRREERVDEHRLSGAGLAGEHREARAEFETQL